MPSARTVICAAPQHLLDDCPIQRVVVYKEDTQSTRKKLLDWIRRALGRCWLGRSCSALHCDGARCTRRRRMLMARLRRLSPQRYMRTYFLLPFKQQLRLATEDRSGTWRPRKEFPFACCGVLSRQRQSDSSTSKAQQRKSAVVLFWRGTQQKALFPRPMQHVLQHCAFTLRFRASYSSGSCRGAPARGRACRDKPPGMRRRRHYSSGGGHLRHPLARGHRRRLLHLQELRRRAVELVLLLLETKGQSGSKRGKGASAWHQRDSQGTESAERGRAP